MRKSVPFAILAILVLSLSVACGSSDDEKTPTTTPTPTPSPTPAPTPAPAPTTASLSGIVQGSGGERISGATVTALDGGNAGQSVNTNTSGEYRFASLNATGTNFSATAPGYREGRAGVNIDGSNTLNFTLTRATASLSGIVRDNGDHRLNNATVTVLDGPNSGQHVDTNENGEYTFASLTSVNTNFSATKSGFNEDRRGVFVNGTNTLNFVLAVAALPDSLTIGEPERITGGTGTPSQEWRFTAVAVGFNFVSYDWDFGDGVTATQTGSVESHVYRSRGDFTVTVVGLRSNGTTVTATRTFTID